MLISHPRTLLSSASLSCLSYCTGTKSYEVVGSLDCLKFGSEVASSEYIFKLVIESTSYGLEVRVGQFDGVVWLGDDCVDHPFKLLEVDTETG